MILLLRLLRGVVVASAKHTARPLHPGARDQGPTTKKNILLMVVLRGVVAAAKEQPAGESEGFQEQPAAQRSGSRQGHQPVVLLLLVSVRSWGLRQKQGGAQSRRE